MRHKITALLLLVLLATGILMHAASGEEVCPTPTPCTEGIDGGAQVSEGTICIYLFYGETCPHCARVEPYIHEVVRRYPQVELRELEVYSNASNQALFRDFLGRYDVNVVGVPMLFIGDRVLIGESAIRSDLEPSIRYFMEYGPICPETYRKYGGNPHEISPGSMVNLTLPVVVTAAMVDSINPCAFAVLAILLVYLTSLGDRRRVLLVGVTYILTVYLVYFVSGVGLLTIVQSTGLTGPVFTLAAVIAIAAGAINILEAIRSEGRFTLSIPERGKGAIREYVARASIPAAIVLGALVSIFELPCTGGIYLAILGLLASRLTFAEGVPYLLLYNAIFVLPLVLILALVYWGYSPAVVERWRAETRLAIRIGMGVLMIALGAAMLAGIL